jgi:hypothetical protein
MLSQNNSIRLRGLRKSARKRACALGRAWCCFIYKDIDHIMKCEHERALLRLPREMAPMIIFPYNCTVTRNTSQVRAELRFEVEFWEIDTY